MWRAHDVESTEFALEYGASAAPSVRNLLCMAGLGVGAPNPKCGHFFLAKNFKFFGLEMIR